MKSVLLRFKGPRIRTVNKYVCLLLAILMLLVSAGLIFQAKERVKIEQKTSEKLASALRELDELKQQNKQLREIFQRIELREPTKEEEINITFMQLWHSIKTAQGLLNIQTSSASGTGSADTTREGPSTKYELTRRRVLEGVNEMWFFFSAQLKLLLEKKNLTVAHPEVTSQIHRMMEEGVEHKRSMLRIAQQLAVDDGYATWRDREARELGEIVQRRLHRLQNPQDCKAARKLVCHVHRFCGYACQITHIFYCLMQAYGTQRTMILENDIWTSYQPARWSDIFLNVTNCNDEVDKNAPWPGDANTPVIRMNFVEMLEPKPEFVPLAIPRDLAPRLTRLHGEPAAWWAGQFFRYLLRTKPNVINITQQATLRLNFSSPIVGVQIRRSDKIRGEAKYHALEEYMSVVEEYYTQLELSQHVEKRRVYMATDDPSVFTEAKEKYPTYEFLGDPKVANIASTYVLRTSDFYGIIIDVHMLAHSDYLVCTFSSGVCRLAYEIMQSLHTDASSKFRSLDDIYYSGSQMYVPRREVVYEHNATRREEIDLKLGDIVHIAGNHWDGYSMGVNNRTGKKGLYPTHKVVQKLNVVEFPTYSDEDEKHSR